MLLDPKEDELDETVLLVAEDALFEDVIGETLLEDVIVEALLVVDEDPLLDEEDEALEIEDDP